MLFHKHFTSVVQLLHNLYTAIMLKTDIKHSFLAELGLTNEEVKIYLSLVEFGGMTISELSRKSAVERTALYRSLEPLKQKQLISTEESNKSKIIAALSPENYLQVLQNEKNRIKKLEINKSEFMSQIQQLHSGAYGISTIQHRGNEAIKQLKNSMQFAKDKKIFSIYDKPFENIIESEFINENNRSLSKNKISCLALYSDSFKQALEKTSGLADSKLDQAKYYYIGQDQFPITEQIDSYDDKVIYYFFEKTPYAVEIQGLAIASTIQNMVKSLINKAQEPETAVVLYSTTLIR